MASANYHEVLVYVRDRRLTRNPRRNRNPMESFLFRAQARSTGRKPAPTETRIFKISRAQMGRIPGRCLPRGSWTGVQDGCRAGSASTVLLVRLLDVCAVLVWPVVTAWSVPSSLRLMVIFRGSGSANRGRQARAAGSWSARKLVSSWGLIGPSAW